MESAVDSLALASRQANLDPPRRHLGVLLLTHEVDLGGAEIGVPGELAHLVQRGPCPGARPSTRRWTAPRVRTLMGWGRSGVSHGPARRDRGAQPSAASAASAARVPLSTAPATVPVSRGWVASPAKKSVPATGRASSVARSPPPTGRYAYAPRAYGSDCQSNTRHRSSSPARCRRSRAKPRAKVVSPASRIASGSRRASRAARGPPDQPVRTGSSDGRAVPHAKNAASG